MSKFFSKNPALSDDHAEIIGLFIEQEFGGNVTPRQLLEAARNPLSPIHQFFEWNDSAAAERYRLAQSRSLIVSIYVTADDNKPIREFLRVKLDDSFTYTSKDQIVGSESLVDQVIAAAYIQLQQWQKRYARYSEFFGVSKEIEALKPLIEKKREAHGEEESSRDRGKAGVDSGRKPQGRYVNIGGNEPTAS